MDFVFEEADYIYQLEVPPPEPLSSKTAEPITVCQAELTATPTSPTTTTTPRTKTTKSVTLSIPSKSSKKAVPGKGPYYQSVVHSPYNSTTLLEWLNKEVLEHQYTILVFYRGQW